MLRQVLVLNQFKIFILYLQNNKNEIRIAFEGLHFHHKAFILEDNTYIE